MDKRVLREYERVAHTVHFCDDCGHQIVPGDFYFGSVHLTKRGIVEWKHHIEPPCPYNAHHDFEEFDGVGEAPDEGLEGFVAEEKKAG